MPGMDQLVPTIDTFVAAVRAGELDKLLAHSRPEAGWLRDCGWKVCFQPRIDSAVGKAEFL